jgi:hypothetical protein
MRDFYDSASIFKGFGVFALALALFFACTQEELNLIDGSSSNDDQLSMFSEGGPLVEPVLFTGGQGGNVECSDLQITYEFSSGRVNYNDGSFSGSFPNGFTITVTEGKFVAWSYVDPTGEYCLDGIAVIVKGGPAANVYTYPSGIDGDSGLRSPDVSGGIADLSNLTLCYNLVKAPEAPEVEGAEECFEEDLVLRPTVVSVEEGAHVVWYDQETDGNVVEDPKIDHIGSKTYWAEAVRSGCVSAARASATLTIWPLPAAPIASQDEVEECFEEGLVLDARDYVTVPDGVHIVWFDKDGHEVAHPTLSEIGSVTYYAQAVDENACESELTPITLTLLDCPDDECFNGETAWAANGNAPGSLRYTNRGNWATYVAYAEKTVNVYAGQNILAGTATFGPNVDGMVKITIALDGATFDEDAGESLKIQDYAKAPSGNPAPGLFAHKFSATGTAAEVWVPANHFYGVHIDALVKVECE